LELGKGQNLGGASKDTVVSLAIYCKYLRRKNTNSSLFKNKGNIPPINAMRPVLPTTKEQYFSKTEQKS
jgi:hypothetical protein